MSTFKHGLRHTPEYNAWSEMRRRCQYPNHPVFHHYGGRGIMVCDRWQDFRNFIADMGRRPSPRHSIDRIDNNGNYEPDNCRWATRLQQARNTRANRMLSFQGRQQAMSAWADELNIPIDVIWARLEVLGWSVERTLSTRPAAKGRRRVFRRRIRSLIVI